jgi:hypothetical protein
MPIEELTEESTTEEITAAVDEIVAQVEEERAVKEPKPDAQIISETAAPANEPEPKKEPKEPAVAEDKSGDEKPAEKSPDWMDDDTKAEIAAYGLDEADIADFTSREDVDRVLNLLDTRFKAEETKEPDDDGSEESEKKPEVREGQYKVSLDPEVYDDEIIGEFDRMRDYYESRLDAIEERYALEEAVATEERFDNIVDSLNATDIFGKTGSESKKELERRTQVMEDVMDKLNGIERRTGQRPELTEAMVRRAARGLFADEFDKKLIKNHTRKISRQSNGRQGGGVTRPTDPREDPRDEFDRLYKELERN